MLASAAPQPPLSLSTGYPPPPALLAATSTPLRYSAGSPMLVDPQPEPPRNIQEDYQATTISTSETRTLKLGNSTTLTFTPADVPFLPAPTFADDLAHLNRMWDDMLTNWDGQSALHIKDVPITIVYWPFVYASSKVDGPWKSRQWNVLKSRHSEWKVCHYNFYGLLFLQPNKCSTLSNNGVKALRPISGRNSVTQEELG